VIIMGIDEIQRSYVFKEVERLLQEQGVNPEIIQTVKRGLISPENIKKLDGWSKRYLEGGKLWGDEPSVCGKRLINNLNPSSLVLEFGCGYGRDSKALLDQGHKVEAIDSSEIAIREAQASLGKHIKKGNAHLIHGDIITAQIIQKNFHAVLSHRTLHLPDPDDVPAIISRLAGALRPNGLLIMTARSPDDFNPTQMNKIDSMTAEYKPEIRENHIVHFYDEDRLKNVLSRQFKDLTFNRGQELESIKNPVMSKFVQVTGRKKTDEELMAPENEELMTPSVA